MSFVEACSQHTQAAWFMFALCLLQVGLVAFLHHYQNSSLCDDFYIPSFGLTAEAATLFLL